ncbi:hypothetical protein [Alistipes sp. ZOR0009]|uniref:hypothetical protein n=1 Tax=Alistipes sp. ZOR0009 TaxID=1339253 RepID=UPI000646454C|nr:hypothetical protein [Alistipes sp. ZOR0009]
MKKLSLEQMEEVEGGWPAWLGGTHIYNGCQQVYSDYKGTQYARYTLWGLIGGEKNITSISNDPC